MTSRRPPRPPRPPKRRRKRPVPRPRPNPKKRPMPPRRPPEQKKRPLRLKPKPFLTLLGLSVVLNIVLLIGLFLPSTPSGDPEEEVASVGKVSITREEWMNAMERDVGRETLQRLVNEEVMEAAAKEYGLEVKEEEIDLELALLSAMDAELLGGVNEEELRKQIRSELIFEKVLTNDVVVKEETMKKYYEDNEALYKIPESYRTFAIIVESKKEAKQTKKELSDGSDFETLARERSLDAASANLGGDLGFLNDMTENVDPAILAQAAILKEEEVSDPIELANGQFAVIVVEQIVPAVSYTFDEVKPHIERLLAMEQLPQNVQPEAFWKDFNARWVYGK